MRLIQVLFYVASIVICVCESTKTEVKINQCITEFIKKFLSSRPLTLLQDAESNSLIHELFANNIPITTRHLSNHQYFGHAVYSNRKFVTPPDAERLVEYDQGKICNDYVLLVKEPKTLYQIVKVVKNETSWNSHAKYLVVLETKENSKQICTETMQVLQDNFVYNVVCAILKDSEIVSFYTWYPYAKEGGCDRKVKAKFLGSGTAWFEDPYKDKVPKNLNKCLVSLGWYALSGVKSVFNFKMLEMFGKLRNSSIG